MSDSRKIASIAFAGAAATAATMMGAAPAFAAASWHVRNGGAGYTGPVKATNKFPTSLKDTTTGTILECAKAVASGVVSKSHSPFFGPLGFLKKTTTKWSSCTGPVPLHFKAHLTTSVPVKASSYSATFGRTGGRLFKSTLRSQISGVISGTNGNTCHATISGTSVPLKYSNTPHSFNVNSDKIATLKLKTVTGNCFGQLNAGDHAYFTGLYHVSTPAALTITRS